MTPLTLSDVLIFIPPTVQGKDFSQLCELIQLYGQQQYWQGRIDSNELKIIASANVQHIDNITLVTPIVNVTKPAA